ncbi:MAG: hypothetical protein ACTHLN_04670 [Tepidisphaeraceae bacterium]
MLKSELTCTLALLIAAAPLTALAEDATQPAKVEVVDYHKLKEQMPEKFAGIKRSKCDGQKMKMGEMTMSSAHAEYRPTGDDSGNKPNADLNVVDYANNDMAKGMAAWSQMEIDQDSDTGFQKTLKLQDAPAMEEYHSDSKTGTITVFVGNRFILSATLNNMSADEFKKAAEELPIKALASLSK